MTRAATHDWTPFGLALKALREAHGMSARALARLVYAVPERINQLQRGKTPIPDSFIDIVAGAMNLTAAEIDALQLARDQTHPTVSVYHLRAWERGLVATLARALDTVPPEVIAQIADLLSYPSHETATAQPVPIYRPRESGVDLHRH